MSCHHTCAVQMESCSTAPRFDLEASAERTGIGASMLVLLEDRRPDPSKSSWFSLWRRRNRRGTVFFCKNRHLLKNYGHNSNTFPTPYCYKLLTTSLSFPKLCGQKKYAQKMCPRGALCNVKHCTNVFMHTYVFGSFFYSVFSVNVCTNMFQHCRNHLKHEECTSDLASPIVERKVLKAHIEYLQ